MESRNLFDRNMVANFNGGGHRGEYLASPTHFLKSKCTWLSVFFFRGGGAFSHLHYFKNLFPLKPLIPAHNAHHLFHFFAEGFVGSGKIGEVVHSLL
jgi:hypothetical protein